MPEWFTHVRILLGALLGILLVVSVLADGASGGTVIGVLVVLALLRPALRRD